VLPTNAKAIINSRIIHGDSVQSVLDHWKSVVNNPRVEINVLTRYVESDLEKNLQSFEKKRKK
jgi:hypothetical protein